MLFYKIPKMIEPQTFRVVKGNRGCGRSLFGKYVYSSLLLHEAQSYATRFYSSIDPKAEKVFNNMLVDAIITQEKVRERYSK